jgi:hypothetical protein
MLRFSAGTLHRLPLDRWRTKTRPMTFDEMIAKTWALFMHGEISQDEAEQLDTNLRRERGRTIVAFRRRGPP